MKLIRCGTDRWEVGNLPYGSRGLISATRKISMAEANAEVDKILREKVPFLGTIKYPTRLDAEREFIERMQKAGLEIEGPEPKGYQADWKPPFLGATGPQILNPAQRIHLSGAESDSASPRQRINTAAVTGILTALVLGAGAAVLGTGEALVSPYKKRNR